jgi:hypothetical protein
LLRGLAAAWCGSINHVIRLENALQVKRFRPLFGEHYAHRKPKSSAKEKPLSNENGLSVTNRLSKESLDLDPDAAPIVAVTATWLPPPIPVLLAFFPLPIIRHDAELQGRLIIALLFHAPAVAIFIADNSG